MRSPDLEKNVVETAYARWAPIYDAVCGPVMVKGRRAAAAAARSIGGKILEVGVGTGLSFDDYDNSTEITGIDMSTPMLEKARAKIDQLQSLTLAAFKHHRALLDERDAWIAVRFAPHPNPLPRVRGRGDESVTHCCTSSFPLLLGEG